MGSIATVASWFLPLAKAGASVTSMGMPGGLSPEMAASVSNYGAAARAYSQNEIVQAAVKILARSAAEPRLIGHRNVRSGADVSAQVRAWRAAGLSDRPGAMRVQALLTKNQYIQDLPDHPLVRLLNNPNPYASRGQLWATVVMDRSLGGNAFLYKARGMGNAVRELWRLRPDRVKVLPGNAQAPIAGYEYKVGRESVVFPAEDVIHFKDLNPLDDFIGMSPLEPIYPRLAIESYMRSFLKGFFEKGGTGPGSILSVESTLAAEEKAEIAARFRRQFGGVAGYHEMLVLDNTKATFQQLGLDRGLRDALPSELNAMQESRIAMPFGIPGSILGLLIGYESSSYANKRADWQVLWDVTMAPLMSDLDDQLNLSLVPEFGGIDAVCFDLSDIRALQEDEDALQDRHRKNYQVGGEAWEEYRQAIGLDPAPSEGHFLLPPGQSFTRASAFDPEEETATGGEVQALALNGLQISSLVQVLKDVTDGILAPDTAKAIIRVAFPSVDEDAIDEMVDSAASFDPKTPEEPQKTATVEPGASTALAVRDALLSLPAGRVGRPPRAEDADALTTWQKAARVKRENPHITDAQLAARVGVVPRTLRRYRATFGEF